VQLTTEDPVGNLFGRRAWGRDGRVYDDESGPSHGYAGEDCRGDGEAQLDAALPKEKVEKCWSTCGRTTAASLTDQAVENSSQRSPSSGFPTIQLVLELADEFVEKALLPALGGSPAATTSSCSSLRHPAKK
jgi:hypothetical protein